MNKIKVKIGIIAVSLLLVAAVIMAASTFGDRTVQAEGKPQEEVSKSRLNIVRVSGRASVTAEPDIAYVNLGVKTVDKDVKTAQRANAKVMKAITASMKAIGISEKDVQTGAFNIYESYDYSQDGRIFEGYEVTHMFTITVRDVDSVGKVFDSAVEAGANIINGVTFDIEDRTELYNDALKMALKNAESKATAIMSSFGEKPGKPLIIDEVGDRSFEPIFREYDMVEGAKMEDGGTQIQSGELVISASVNVEYDY